MAAEAELAEAEEAWVDSSLVGYLHCHHAAGVLLEVLPDLDRGLVYLHPPDPSRQHKGCLFHSEIHNLPCACRLLRGNLRHNHKECLSTYLFNSHPLPSLLLLVRLPPQTVPLHPHQGFWDIAKRITPFLDKGLAI